MKYMPVIGLEIHVGLKTQTKMFCDSLNNPDEKQPNTNVCPICMGHPGTLPVINATAVHKVIATGLALNCTIAHDTFFERKNYFYPDLPKGYQISQYVKPLCEHGQLTLSGGKKIRITRIHLEEDAGRLYHEGDYSLVDYNRAGTPLMELVTEPDFQTGSEVREFASELQLILRYLGASDADMEKGLMRVEVNISLSNPDGSWGTKVEIKNLNSIKAAADGVDFEIKRQTELLEAGEKIKQETRGWDDVKRATVNQRSKEEAHDYRYFPEPDLPPLHFDKKEIDKIRAELPELPNVRFDRFKKTYGLDDIVIGIFVGNKLLGNFFEMVAEHLGTDPKVLRLAANYIITEKQKHVDITGKHMIQPEFFADLIKDIAHGKISSSGAQVVIEHMAKTGQSSVQAIGATGMSQVSDTRALDAVVDAVIAKNEKAVADYKSGKEAPLKFLVGMAMRESKGKGNPQVLEQLIKQKLK